MGRWNIRDIACAAFFFALAGFFAWAFILRLDGPRCTLEAPLPCSLSDMELRTVGLPLTAGIAVLLFGMGLRVLWGMRHGEE